MAKRINTEQITRGKWEATWTNIRALKKKILVQQQAIRRLVARVQALERRLPFQR